MWSGDADHPGGQLIMPPERRAVRQRQRLARCCVRPSLMAHLFAARFVPLMPHASASCWSAGLPEPEASHVIRPRDLRLLVGAHHPSRADPTCDNPLAVRHHR
jgi:hypothetical protein